MPSSLSRLSFIPCPPSPPQPDSLTWSVSCFAGGAVVVFLPPLRVRVGGSARVGWDFCMGDCFHTLHTFTWMRVYAVLFTIQTAVCWLQRLVHQKGRVGGRGGSVQLIAIAGMFSGLWLMSLRQEGCSSKLLFGGHLVIKVLLVTCSGVLPGDFR